MKTVISKTCLRCGSEKKDKKYCNHWGVDFKSHLFTYKESETKEEKRIEELELTLIFQSKAY